MKIAFIGDNRSQNATNWLRALGKAGITDISVWPAAGFARDLLRLPQLRKWLQREKPDLVLGYRTTSYGFLAALVSNRPLVVAVQGETDLWPYHPLTLPFKHFTKFYSVRKAAMIHAWGENMLPSLLSHGAAREKILVKPRGIDLAKFAYSEDKQGVHLISTRSLYPEYHHEKSLQVVAGLAARGVACRLTLIGEGPQLGALQKKAEHLGIADRVRFPGRIDYDLIPAYLQASSFYISMPETEGTSSSLLEAMACGCYPLVADLPANRTWIRSGDNGMLSQDPEEIATHIMVLKDNRQQFVRAIRQNRKLVEQQADITKNMQLFVRKYLELAGK